jgi:hypothetical protein
MPRGGTAIRVSGPEEAIRECWKKKSALEMLEKEERSGR